MTVLQVMGATIPRINYESLMDISIPLPPLNEQREIASFLDRETAKLDALIHKSERLITLLREKRQALISHAVTKGLDEHAETRDSGVEWLGQIPSHWEARRLKHCATIRAIQVDPTLEKYRQVKLVAPNHIESSTGRLLEVFSVEQEGVVSAKVPFEKDDILYSKIRPNLHKVCIAPFQGLWQFRHISLGAAQMYCFIVLSIFFS